jgi:hypothetical protein
MELLVCIAPNAACVEFHQFYFLWRLFLFFRTHD